MRLQWLAIGLGASMLTCNPIRYVSDTRQYNVYIDTSFTPEQRDAIITATMEWESATLETVTFVFSIIKDKSQSLIVITPSTMTGLRILFPEEFKDEEKHGMYLIGMTSHRGSDNQVYIATDISKRDFFQTALHEVGHSIGLPHDENADHEMKTTMNPDTHKSTTHLTCLDMQAFCKQWGCNYNRFPLCRSDQ